MVLCGLGVVVALCGLGVVVVLSGCGGFEWLWWF